MLHLRGSIFCCFQMEWPMFICVCAQLLTHVWFVMTPWFISYQDPLSMEFLSQENWSEFPFHLQRIFVTQGWNPHFQPLLHWKVDYLPLRHLGSQNVLQIWRKSIWFNVSLKVYVSLLIFCLDKLSIGLVGCSSSPLLLCDCQFPFFVCYDLPLYWGSAILGA